jgi:hypothetical protein
MLGATLHHICKKLAEEEDNYQGRKAIKLPCTLHRLSKRAARYWNIIFSRYKTRFACNIQAA